MQNLGEISAKIVEELRIKLDRQGEQVRGYKSARPLPYASGGTGEEPTSDLNKKPLEQTKGVDVSGLKHISDRKGGHAALSPTQLRRCKRIASPKQVITPPVVVRLHMRK